MTDWRWSAACMGLILLFSVSGGMAGTMSVQVETSVLRQSPSFLGQPVADVQYADRVTVIQERGPWMQVRSDEGAGWIHQSALTRKKIVLQASEAEVRQAASGEELALAGKGFNQEVEANFKKQNPSLDFSTVDRMETFEVSPREVEAFLKAGNVGPRGGAQ